LGAHHALDPAAVDVARELSHLLGEPGADHVIVATGAPSAHTGALTLAAPSGAVTIVGMPADGVTQEIAPGDLAGADQRIIGSKMGGAVPECDIVELAYAHNTGEFDLDALVTHRYPFAEINTAIDDVRRGATRRSVVLIEHSTSITPEGHEQ